LEDKQMARRGTPERLNALFDILDLLVVRLTLLAVLIAGAITIFRHL